MDLYPVFAGWAKKHGLENAFSRFESSLGSEEAGAYRDLFKHDLAKVQAGGPPVIAAGKPGWYSGPGEDDLFWPPLRESFTSMNWPADRVDSLDTASSTVVAHTPRPDKSAFDSRGLVVGFVQSGKTTNFLSVIAKLADEDYRMVIVLSGIHNGLRKQTQRRLDEQLKKLNPDKWWPLTGELSDFHIPDASPSAPLLSDKCVLAVVKKNATVLERLIEWLAKPDGQKALRTARVLVIDDEADQASVATGRINPLIRKLLNLMPRSTYVGYTATPFANVFIDPSANDDLYPRDFILNLPRPDGYFGPEMIFGRDLAEGEDAGLAPDGYDMVRIVPNEDIPLLRPMGKVLAGSFSPTMTKELTDAVRWFWVSTAARRARGDNGHSTMLVHTSVKNDVHVSYREPLLKLREQALADFDGFDPAKLAAWRAFWDAESARVPAVDWDRTQNTFDEILPYLRQTIDSTRVVLDNYRSTDRLVYSDDEPTVAIAVGGNTLSRGLTLEGLVVSFFVRAATAYDTLLQMGRWFGFRGGYEDLPRIWMTKALQGAFRHLAMVEHEMRADIDYYQQQNLTPLDVGVRIRTHPSLRITAKMGAARPTFVSYAGRRLQTRYFQSNDIGWLEDNLDAARDLVQTALATGDRESADSYELLRNVPVRPILQFLSQYTVHGDSPDLDSNLMTKYIERQIGESPSSLHTWSVAVMSGSESTIDLGGLSVKTLIRSKLNDNNPDRADIKTLMSKQDRALDLDLSVAEAKSAPEGKLVTLRNADKVHHDQGLIVIYPINSVSEPVRDQPTDGVVRRVALDAATTVIGFGIVFPGNAQLKNQITGSHVAVDLSDVEKEDLEEALDHDTEDDAE
ncbi:MULTISPECIES: Z1 domain-containing protein [Cryobacterium]|uniref:Z1 domain-containing protein n=1 Tax=Cryobacterium TaxID=69578 RepID=UPI0010570043|nr:MULTISPECIES: Z1 domain-containing protein [Cryobacterium]TFC42960.1 hypothetical protein E3O57_14640 [Cryobacterium sp. TMN-39-2]